MKKIATTSILLAVSGLAAAQSSVTLFGVLDTVVQHGSGSVADRTQLGSGGNNTSRLGFRGVEDLGGGMSASFWLEAAILPDSGAGGPTSTNNQPSGTPASAGGGQGLTFARRSTVSLAGNWGEVRLGRDYSPGYYSRATFDPFGNVAAGASQAHVGSLAIALNRVSNEMAYWLPKGLGGFYGVAAYYLGENASNAGATKNDGNGGGVRLGWSNGVADVAVAHNVTQYAKTATAGDITSSNIGASYAFGNFTVMGAVFRDHVDTTARVTGKGGQLGGIWQTGNNLVKFMYSQYGTNAATKPETKKLALGYVYSLSKRTAVYTTVARVRNSGGATTALNGATTAPNQSSSGIDVGLRHSF